MLSAVTRVLTALLLLTAIGMAAIVAHGWMRAELPAGRRAPSFQASTDSAWIARGEHLARVTCAPCHAPDGRPPLSGGSENLLALDSTRALGILWAANLTPAGVLRTMSDGQIEVAIREGVGSDGHPLLIMPSEHYRHLSDLDVAALVGYLRSQPTLERVLPPRRLGIAPYILLGLHQISTSAQPPVRAPIPHPTETDGPEYGEYLTQMIGCGDCHGADLRGGTTGPAHVVRGSDLIALAHREEFPAFDRALRGGIGSSGQTLAPTMPWRVYSQLTDVESRAIYALLKSRPS